MAVKIEKSGTYNLCNSNTEDDYTTVYDLSGGDTEFIIPVRATKSARVELLWGQFSYDSSNYGTNLDALDATIQLYESVDSENSQPNPNAPIITLSPASGANGFETSLVKSQYLHVKITVNSVTTGTVRVLTTLKPR